MLPSLGLLPIHVLHHPRSCIFVRHQHIFHHVIPFAQLVQFLHSKLQMLRVLIVGQLGQLPSGLEPFQQPLLRTLMRYILGNVSEFDNYK